MGQSKSRKAQHKRAVLMALNPNTCFCKDAPHSFSDEFVRYSEPMYSIYDYYKNRPIRLPIRRCSVCGKEYLEVVAEAWAWIR